ncbi:MAG: HPr kinase/phosphorylase [Nitratireductor sp.]|nr:HPr kinase/phosphorylase [Nitratireductor sp.]
MTSPANPARDTTAPRNHHCCVVSVDGRGVLIEGPSGSGKTSLALGLVDAARARGIAAALVCDDQALLSIEDGMLVARPPQSIAGKAELAGYGVIDVASAEASTVTLIGRLVADETLERMPEPECSAQIAGLRPRGPIRLIHLPRRHEAQSVRILLAILAETPQDPTG